MSKKGRLYFKLLLAAVIIAAAIYSFTTFAGNNLKRLEAYLLERVA